MATAFAGVINKTVEECRTIVLSRSVFNEMIKPNLPKTIEIPPPNFSTCMLCNNLYHLYQLEKKAKGYLIEDYSEKMVTNLANIRKLHFAALHEFDARVKSKKVKITIIRMSEGTFTLQEIEEMKKNNPDFKVHKIIDVKPKKKDCKRAPFKRVQYTHRCSNPDCKN